MKGRFALLLDSGYQLRLPKAKTIEQAREHLAANNARHREGMADRERYRYDYERFPLVVPRLAVGLVRPKRRKRRSKVNA